MESQQQPVDDLMRMDVESRQGEDDADLQEHEEDHQEIVEALDELVARLWMRNTFILNLGLFGLF